MDEVLARHPADDDEQLAEQGAVLVLHVEQFLQFLLAEKAPSDQKVPEEFLRILRRRRDNQAVSEVDLLVVRLPLHRQGARLTAVGDPLQQVRKGHRAEVPAN